MPPIRSHRFQNYVDAPSACRWSVMTPAAESVLYYFDDMLCVLPPKQKEIIIVSILERRSIAESAIVIGQSEEELVRRLDQAFESLYSLLLEYGVCISHHILRFIVSLMLPDRVMDHVSENLMASNVKIRTEEGVNAMVTKRKSRGSQRMASISHSMPIPEMPVDETYTASRACSRADKEVAFALAYRNYVDQGYIEKNELGLLINDYDTHESTQVLIVKNRSERVIATVTIVFAAQTEIPSAATFDYGSMGIDVSQAVELSRIVVEEGYEKDEIILQKLVAWTYLSARHLSPAGCMLAEVNPKHVFYYTQMFGFEILGDEAPCLMVGNAPAVLMRLPFQSIQSAILGRSQGVHVHFLDVYEEERRIYIP